LAVRPFFVTERSIGNPEGSHYRVDGTKERLTRDRDNDYDPAWQPIR
jgi:hypothetical protein